MKRITLLLFALVLSGIAIAGGIYTNTNQSAKWTRLMWRDATLGIDATYFNPAGMSLMPNNGFYLSINNQTLGQSKTIYSNYPYLYGAPKTEYDGKVSAPFFPGLYAAYKVGKLAISFGFNPIGGGGGADFEKGLPSFEMPVSDLVPVLQGSLAPIDAAIEQGTGQDPGFRNVSGYQLGVDFSGTSIYWGYQLNVSYAINDIISVALGGRFVSAKNTYEGYLKDIKIIAPDIYGGAQRAGDYLRLVAGTPGLPADVVANLQGTAAYLDVQTADAIVDVEETGNGFTPIISVNIAASEKWNFAVKYEHKTKLELETKVNDGKDGNGMYVDGSKARADMPSQIVIGATYKPIERLLLSAGFHMYLDPNADYGKTETIVDPETGAKSTVPLNNADILNNSLEFGLGAEFSITDKLVVSAGWLGTQTGATEAYQTDFSYSLNSNSIGGGIGYKISPMFEVNIGGMYTSYQEGSKTYDHYLGVTPVPVTETYDKDIWAVAIGLDFNFGAKKD